MKHLTNHIEQLLSTMERTSIKSQFINYGPDESSIAILIIEQHNPFQWDDEEHNEFQDKLDTAYAKIISQDWLYFLNQEISELSYSWTEQGGNDTTLRVFSTPYNDRFTIQGTDSRIYITYQLSGQY